MRLHLPVAALLGAFLLGPRATTAVARDGASSSAFVALPVRALERELHFCSRQGPADVSGFWQVPGDLAARIDKRLLRKVREKSLRKQLAGDPSVYIRQYVGIVRRGRRHVYVNASMHYIPSWKSQLIVYCDDGSYSWGVEYDLSSGSFQEFRVNSAFNRDPLEGIKL